MATYAIADLHGRYDLLEKVKKKLKPKDVVYVLGDCGDRGPQPWETIKEVLINPHFIYIKGNHEDLLINAGKDYLEDRFGTQSTYFLLSNGGKQTFKEFTQSENPRFYLNKLKELPIEEIYKNKNGDIIHLSHAGYTPGSMYKDLLWDREHCLDDWPSSGYENYYVVHGHTPIQYCEEWSRTGEHKPYFYADGHKINIDLGAYSSGYTCLLNLDTFEYELIF